MPNTTDSKFDIGEFRSEVSYDYHQTSHFHFITSSPPGLSGAQNSGAQENFNDTAKTLLFEVEAAKMPGIQLATDEVRRYGIGSTQLKPYAPIFDKLQIVVRSDAEGKIYDFFQSWLKLVINFDLRNGLDRAPGFGSASAFEVNYMQNYAVESELISYSKTGDEVTKIKLRNSFPIFINDISYDWASGAQIVKIPVVFAFSDWYQERSIGALSAESVPITSPTGSGTANGSVGGGQGSVKVISVTPTNRK
jgi:hypothetical protein